MHNNKTSERRGSYKCTPLLRHCEKETSDPVEGSVRGVIPSWLQGELVRVGPGIRKIGNEQYRHILDGLAILHKFRICNGKVYYQSRALHSDAYARNMEANRIVVSEFGTHVLPDPCQTLFGRFKTNFKWLASIFKKGFTTVIEDEITDNCTVNVGYYGDQLYAMTETSHIRRVDPSSLEIIGEKTTIGHYIAMNSASAHPHVLEDGTMINLGNNFKHHKGPHYCFMKVEPSYNSDQTSLINAKTIAEIPSRWKLHPSYFHSFGITKSGKLIFIESPFCTNLVGIALGNYFVRKSYSEWMKWYPHEKTRFFVISMDDGRIHPLIYETEKLFLFHHINAYEENDQLIVDVVGYSDAQWIREMGANEDTKVERRTGKVYSDAAARRYILPLRIAENRVPGENLVSTTTSAKATLRNSESNIIDLQPHYFTETTHVYELPRINYKFNGKKYRYFYILGSSVPGETFEEVIMDMITKVNTLTGESISWHVEKMTHVSEPVFVPDPKSKGEDEGVLLTTLISLDKQTSVRLLIINAKDMTEIGELSFTAAGTVTGTLHGQWAQTGETIHVY